MSGLLSDLRTSIEGQVWYGDSDLAREFANELGTQLGTMNVIGSLGPFFGFDIYDGVGADYTVSWVYKPSNFHLAPDNRAQVQNAAAGVTNTYAIGTYVGAAQIPEPSSVALVIASLLLAGWAGRRRSVPLG